MLLSDVFLPDQRYVGAGILPDPEHDSENCVPLITSNCSSCNCVVEPDADMYITGTVGPPARL